MWNARHRLSASSGLHLVRIEHLLHRYGTLVEEVLELVAQDPSLGEPLAGTEDYLRAEVVYAVTHEGARHLDDVLTRRTRISIETFHRGTSSAEDAAALMGAGPGLERRAAHHRGRALPAAGGRRAGEPGDARRPDRRRGADGRPRRRPPGVSGVVLRHARFDELDPRTAYALWRLREAVFVVEQDCPYQELDGRDLEPGTWHVWAADPDTAPDADTDAGQELRPGQEPVAYLRVLEEGEVARVGRVLVAAQHRGTGLAGRLMATALELVGERPSVLAAQSHLAAWYARFGYRRDGEDFVEDGIPHTPMRRD